MVPDECLVQAMDSNTSSSNNKINALQLSCLDQQAKEEEEEGGGKQQPPTWEGDNNNGQEEIAEKENTNCQAPALEGESTVPSLSAEEKDSSKGEETGESQKTNNGQIDEQPPRVVLKIPHARLNSDGEDSGKNGVTHNGIDLTSDSSGNDVPATGMPVTCSALPVTSTISSENTPVTDGNCVTATDDAPSRRSSYIDVVGLSGEDGPPLNGGDAMGAPAEESDDEEDKLVIHEGGEGRGKEEEEMGGSGKRSASEDSDDSNPKKKSRLLDVPSPSLTESCPVGEVMNLSRKGEAKPQAEATVEQVDGALAQVNKEIQGLQRELLKKEEEWNSLLRELKEKEQLAMKLKRKNQVLQFQSGAADLSLTSAVDFSAKEESGRENLSKSGLFAALTSTSQQNANYEGPSPLAMMSKLLSQQGTGLSPSSTDTTRSLAHSSSPNVSIIDIHTRTSPSNSISTSTLSDALKSKLTRQLLSVSATLAKPILPKPSLTTTPNGNNLLSSLASQTPASLTPVPQTLAGMLNGPASRENSILAAAAAAVNNMPPTGYGPQGPTISVQQIIDAHRKDNPSSPPVRGAKRGAYRQKYDGKRGGRIDAGISLNDPNLSYNDMLLQFAQLTQQQHQAAQQRAGGGGDKTSAPSPQISIIPVTDGSSVGSSLNTSSLGLSVTPTLTSSKPGLTNPSPIMEQSSALAKLLMESRGGTAKQNSLAEQQQANNSQYLTLSALLSGGTTTTVREKAAAAASALASAQQNKKSEGSGGDVSSNPKCQGCHKVRAQFVCAGCGNQWYCSRECQVAAWDEHSERCNT